MANRYTIHLIRHLPTAGNQEKKYIGWTDEPILNTDVRSPLSITKPTVFGSDLLRAKQTAAVYFPKAVYEEDCRWRECNFGVFEGKTYAELEMNKGYRQWIDDPYKNAPPDGESLLEVESRVRAVLMKLPADAVVVTHGGPIRAILTTFSSIEKEFWSWIIPHGSCYRLEWENEKAFEEGRPCMSISAVPITVNEIM